MKYSLLSAAALTLTLAVPGAALADGIATAPITGTRRDVSG